LFTQTCGYPLFTTARGHFTVLGAPCYGVPGCAGPQHRSYIVVHDASPVRTVEDLRGASFAINEADSNSGMNLPRRLFAPLARSGRFFARTVLTGSHAASASLVSAEGVDSAAIDCVTYALLMRYRPGVVRDLRIVAETAATPAPPLVTSRRTSDSVAAALRRGLSRITRGPAYAELREALFLADIEFCGEEDYEVIMVYKREAEEVGYPVLA
jgi:ABC-type phosphate/phosphonate transport system substrate-binding protein